MMDDVVQLRAELNTAIELMKDVVFEHGGFTDLDGNMLPEFTIIEGNVYGGNGRYLRYGMKACHAFLLKHQISNVKGKTNA